MNLSSTNPGNFKGVIEFTSASERSSIVNIRFNRFLILSDELHPLASILGLF